MNDMSCKPFTDDISGDVSRAWPR